MKVLFLDAYYEPEQIAFTHLENDLIQGLINEGHTVHIICPIPTRGINAKIAKKYSKIKHQSRFKGKVKIDRFWAPQEVKNPILRAIRYFWCNIRTYQIGKTIKNIDVVFANSTPPTQGLVAGIVAKKLGVPFIYSLQDIFPDSLVTTGLSSEKSITYKIGRLVENATYKKCKKIIVISNSMKDNLLKKGIDSSKISVISNWIDTDAIKPVKREENKLFDEFGIDRNKFIVLYAGNFGQAQGAEIIFEVAEKLLDNKDIFFVIFGGGSGFETAKKRAQSLPTVFIHPLLSQDRVSEVYSMGDVALITCKKGVGRSGMPSKTWSIMACNTPILACFDVDSEMYQILTRTRVGKCIEAENKDALIEELQFLKRNRKSESGREYVKRFCSKNMCVFNYINEMRQACENTDD